MGDNGGCHYQNWSWHDFGCTLVDVLLVLDWGLPGASFHSELDPRKSSRRRSRTCFEGGPLLKLVSEELKIGVFQVFPIIDHISFQFIISHLSDIMSSHIMNMFVCVCCIFVLDSLEIL